MFLSIRKWFTASRPQSRTRSRPTVRLGLESLEARDVPTFFGGFHIPVPTLPPALVAPAPQTLTLNDQIINFCKSHLHSKVGGGECAQLVSEALRVSGADFVAHDPGNGAYTWGTRINTYTHGHATSSTACKPGDILQFQGVKLSNGQSPQHHTAIVAAVDNLGRPTMVYEENVAGDRTERLDALAVNPSTILSGTVYVYRAIPRHDAPGQIQFSVVNDTNKSVSVTLYFNGKAEGSIPLSSFNTAASYLTDSVSSTGGGSWSIGINGHTARLTSAGGYEVYSLSNGQASIRAI